MLGENCSEPLPVKDCAYRGPKSEPEGKSTFAHGASTVPSKRLVAMYTLLMLKKFHQTRVPYCTRPERSPSSS